MMDFLTWPGSSGTDHSLPMKEDGATMHTQSQSSNCQVSNSNMKTRFFNNAEDISMVPTLRMTRSIKEYQGSFKSPSPRQFKPRIA